MLKKISYSSFLLGFIFSFVLFFVIMLTTFFLLINRGVTVNIDLHEHNPKIVNQVREIIEIQLPFFVDNLKKEIPYIIDAEMTGKISNASIRIGDIEYPLPRDTIKGIEEKFKSQVQLAMIKLLEGLDEKSVAQSISQDVSIRLEHFIDERVHNQTIIFNPFYRLSLPVTIVVNNPKENQ